MTTWQAKFSRRGADLRPSAIRQTAVHAAEPGMISFASGSPNPDLFPQTTAIRAVSAIINDSGLRKQALQYGASEGYAPLRELIAERARGEGCTVTAAHTLIVNGSQQALEFIGKLMLDKGDRVIVTDPTYLGALQAFNLFEPVYAGVTCDSSGLDLAALEREFARGAKFFYLMPDAGNPSGVTLSLEQRRHILALARRYQIPIVEDQAYAELWLGAGKLPTMLALDSAEGEPELVIHAGTFSKSIAPGLRVGWIIAPKPVLEKLVFVKQASDLQGSLLNHMIVHAIASDDFAGHTNALRDAYRRRRDLMLAALGRQMPQEVRWSEPSGGMFIWLELPEPLDAMAVQQRGVTVEKVVFVPGAPFFAHDAGKNTLRLSYSLCPEDAIEEGISRLARAIRHCMAENDGRAVG